MSDSDAPTRVPIARRKLARQDGSVVELVVNTPATDPESAGDDWVCEVDVIDAGRVTTHRGHGVDSLQALVGGLGALREAVKGLGIRDLSWLGQAGVAGVPMVIQETDEDYLTLLETIIAVEHLRGFMQRKRQPNK